MNERLGKTVLAFLLGFVAALIATLINGLPFGEALLRSFIYGLLAAAIVAVLAWGYEMAVYKGYPGWLGFWLVALLPVLGILIVLLLPERRSARY